MVKIFAQSYREDFVGRNFPAVFYTAENLTSAKDVILSYNGDLGAIDFWVIDEEENTWYLNDEETGLIKD